jgi:hypothetical protein
MTSRCREARDAAPRAPEQGNDGIRSSSAVTMAGDFDALEALLSDAFVETDHW